MKPEICANHSTNTTSNDGTCDAKKAWPLEVERVVDVDLCGNANATHVQCCMNLHTWSGYACDPAVARPAWRPGRPSPCPNFHQTQAPGIPLGWGTRIRGLLRESGTTRRSDIRAGFPSNRMRLARAALSAKRASPSALHPARCSSPLLTHAARWSTAAPPTGADARACVACSCLPPAGRRSHPAPGHLCGPAVGPPPRQCCASSAPSDRLTSEGHSGASAAANHEHVNGSNRGSEDGSGSCSDRPATRSPICSASHGPSPCQPVERAGRAGHECTAGRASPIGYAFVFGIGFVRYGGSRSIALVGPGPVICPRCWGSGRAGHNAFATGRTGVSSECMMSLACVA
eukprot:1635020-Alexandrium_andersonii.AAC.1